MPSSRSRKPLGAAQGPPAVIAYYRVSTEQQGRSGLGLEAQKAAVAKHVASTLSRLIGEYEEVESGKRADRPQLLAALAACRARRATLVIAKLDRLARNVRFLLSVVEGCGEGGVMFCDLPQIPTGAVGKFLVTLLAAVAELEAGLISQRTKAALAAAKARGVQLGGRNLRKGTAQATAQAGRQAQTDRASDHAADVLPYIDAARRAGATSLRQIAEALTARGVQPPAGGDAWHPQQIRRLLQRAPTPAHA